MDKKKRMIIGTIVVIVVLIVSIILISKNMGNNGTGKEKAEQTTTIEQSKEETTLRDDEYPTLEDITEDEKESNTNYFDNVEVYEETTKKGNNSQESEAYPGENDGWSPIVSPDELEE